MQIISIIASKIRNGQKLNEHEAQMRDDIRTIVESHEMGDMIRQEMRRVLGLVSSIPEHNSPATLDEQREVVPLTTGSDYL